MLAALGQGLLVLAALAGAIAAGAGLGGRSERAGRIARFASVALGGALLAALGALLTALLRDDFTVRYVAQVGSRSAPTWVKVSALWAGMDGSLLCFAALLAVMGGLVALRPGALTPEETRPAVGLMAATTLGILVLVAGPASAFRALAVSPADGPGPPPLLQDHWLMLVHPPVLYLGAVATLPLWALAVVGLRRGLSKGLARALRTWALVSFAALGTGILLGAWWAYAVLGWGGYWAWDPVENASLLPFLAVTAALHVLPSAQRAPRWAPLALGLCTSALLLVVLGTFITRSGVVGSVHAFARSTLGPYFLGLLAALVAVTLVAWLRGRGASAKSGSAGFRGWALVAGGAVLAVLTVLVLAGTLAPTIIEAVSGSRVAVGERFFTDAVAPLALVLLFLMGVAPVLPWGKTSLEAGLRALRWPLLGAAATTLGCWALGARHPAALATFSVCAFAALSALTRLAWPGVKAPGRLLSTEGFAARRSLGAGLCHLALVVVLVGVAASSAFATRLTATAAPGESFALGDYRVRFEGLVTKEEPHRRYVAAALTFINPAGLELRLPAEEGPRLTFYPRREAPLGKPAVRTDRTGDLYVTLAGFDAETKQAGFTGAFFPLVGLIWGAIPLLLLGAALCLWRGRGMAVSAPASAHDASA